MKEQRGYAMTEAVWRLSAADLHKAYTSGALSPVGVTRAILIASRL